MRLLLIVIVAASALWSGYWWFGSRVVETGLRGWLDGRAADGWVAEYSSIRTRGFPNRFDTTVERLELADPAKGVAWSAPLFQILRLSYRPNHVIAVWPGEQTLATREERVTVNTSQARASLVLKPGADMKLDRATAVFENIRLASSVGWTAEVGEGRIAAHASETARRAVNIGVEARDIRPASEGMRRLVSAGAVPDVPAFLKLDAELAFDSVWNRHAIETRRPVLTAIRLNMLQVIRGELEIGVAGDLMLDADGLAGGNRTVKARNWPEIPLFAAAVGRFSEGHLSLLEKGIGLLAAFSGASETPEIPLTFRRGEISVGSVPVGTLGSWPTR